MKRVPIIWRMRSEVNGMAFDLDGEGYGDVERGETRIHFRVSEAGFPKGFDPVSCPCICNAPTTASFARQLADTAALLEVSGQCFRVQPARVGRIHDPQGKELLNLSVSSTVTMSSRGLLVTNQMTGFSNLPELEANLVPAGSYLLPAGPDEATEVLRFRLRTKAGEELHGTTLVPYRWENGRSLQAPLARLIEENEVHWSGRDVVAHFRSAWAPVEQLQPTS